MSTASFVMTSIGALAHIATVVLPYDTQQVEEDFMSALENDFNMSYSSEDDPRYIIVPQFLFREEACVSPIMVCFSGRL
jgi:hypothetical protein